ncbi:hypothetical protein BofuT4_uP069780.1 [Botrytis cinerea T4]|uniref:Uncharacterized protein n=1 Tax=Botryotinia fuckeliana (strain T4) TaxID=999810 RepID=G2XQN3_BOTF4|nr:hypothetical protein BofuT4_uP069780.1 [Botrytis cinerea T4]
MAPRPNTTKDLTLWQNILKDPRTLKVILLYFIPFTKSSVIFTFPFTFTPIWSLM